MITPSFSPTATERVLPRLALDFTTASLDPRVTVTRALNTATCINSSGYIEIVNANLPRFDYSSTSIGTCRGLLIEESRTNLVRYSSDFSNALWVKTNITLTANAATAPDGTATAYKIEATAAASVIQSVTATATSHTYTIFAKQGSAANQGARFLLRNDTTATNLVGVLVDYSNGSFIYTAGTTGASVEAYPNGWWRITLTATTGITVGNTLLTYVAFTGGGAAGHYSYAWGAQLEAGAFATSYIPTTTTALARNSDQVEMTGTNFSSWFNQTEGTFGVWFDTAAAGGSFNIWALAAADATPSGRYMIGGNPSNLRGFVSAGGSTQADMFSGTIANNTLKKAVLAYKTDSFAFSTGGLAPTTDSLGTLPTPTRMWIGQYNGTYLYGHVAKLLYWPQRLINAETSAFSK